MHGSDTNLNSENAWFFVFVFFLHKGIYGMPETVGPNCAPNYNCLPPPGTVPSVGWILYARNSVRCHHICLGVLKVSQLTIFALTLKAIDFF